MPGITSMSETQIQMRLVGSDEDNGVVQFDDFRLFCDKVSDCLRRAEAAVTSETVHIRYRLTDLRGGSAAMTLEAVAPKKGPDHRTEIVGLFKRTVSDLEVGTSFDS